MGKLNWDVRSLALLLGYVFLQKMATNMRKAEEATVQVGELGQGVQPNYHVHLSSTVVNRYRGSTHKPFLRLKGEEEKKENAFDEQNLSRKFSLADIREAIGIAKKEGVA